MKTINRCAIKLRQNEQVDGLITVLCSQTKIMIRKKRMRMRSILWVPKGVGNLFFSSSY